MIIYLLQQHLLSYLCSMKIEAAIKQTKFKDIYQKMMLNLMYTGNWIRDEQIRQMKPFDILPQHYNALRIIKGKHPQPISPGEIKEVLIDKANDLTRLLDKLEKKGYIKRNLCPSNRRKMDISLTKSGLDLLSTMEQPLEIFNYQIRERITKAEAEQLSNLLENLRG